MQGYYRLKILLMLNLINVYEDIYFEKKFRVRYLNWGYK